MGVQPTKYILTTKYILNIYQTYTKHISTTNKKADRQRHKSGSFNNQIHKLQQNIYIEDIQNIYIEDKRQNIYQINTKYMYIFTINIYLGRQTETQKLEFQ